MVQPISMPFGFTFATTPDDANPQYFERSKGNLFGSLALEKRVFNPSPLPASFAPSTILQMMLKAYSSPDTGVTVVFSESGFGKSVAGRLLLSKASRGIMFGGKRQSHGIYWRLVAAYLGVPRERGYENFQNWVNILVERVTKTRGDNGPWSFCSERHAPMELPLPVEFDTEILHRPLLIFDDFDGGTDEDINFMSVVYDAADKNEILTFVLTSDRLVANRLLKLNHWRRVRPLDGAYIDSRKVELPDGSFNDPQWIPMSWTMTQLEKLLVCHGFDDDEIAQVAPTTGENPNDVLLRAKRHFRRNRPIHGL